MVLEKQCERIFPTTFADLNHARMYVWLQLGIGKMSLGHRIAGFTIVFGATSVDEKARGTGIARWINAASQAN